MEDEDDDFGELSDSLTTTGSVSQNPQEAGTSKQNP